MGVQRSPGSQSGCYEAETGRRPCLEIYEALIRAVNLHLTQCYFHYKKSAEGRVGHANLDQMSLQPSLRTLVTPGSSSSATTNTVIRHADMIDADKQSDGVTDLAGPRPFFS